MTDDLTVFISYRRADSSADAGRLYDALRRRFGRESLFMDVDNLRPGEDWVDAVDAAVSRCDVLLAIIGPMWVGAADSDGESRLQKQLDRVRLEIEAALRNKKSVIPVLVEGASMPAADQLPDSLQPLLRRHAIRISHTTFESDLGALVRALKTIDRARHPKPAPTEDSAPAVASETNSTSNQGPGLAAPLAAVTLAPPISTPTVSPAELDQASVTLPYAAIQPPVPPALPVYPIPPAPAQYPYPAQPYGYPPSVPARKGTSPVLLGFLGLGAVLLIGVVLMAGLHLGPFAVTAVTSPTPFATPTSSPVTATPTPTASPVTPTLTPSPILVTPSPIVVTPPPLVIDPTAALMAYVPSAIRDSCFDAGSTPPALANVDCETDDGKISVSYYLFPDLASMDSKFDSWRGISDATSGSCADSADWPRTDGYTVNEVHAGRVLCQLTDGVPEMFWTDERLNVFTWVWNTTDTATRLYTFYKDEAGPNPSAAP